MIGWNRLLCDGISQGIWLMLPQADTPHDNQLMAAVWMWQGEWRRAAAKRSWLAQQHTTSLTFFFFFLQEIVNCIRHVDFIIGHGSNLVAQVLRIKLWLATMLP